MNELLREHLTTSVKPPHGGAQAPQADFDVTQA
jgi:hypothetical protein